MKEQRKRRKSFHNFGDVHLFTFSCYRRQPFMVQPGVADRFIECLKRAAIKEELGLLAWVMMPEHVHVLVRPKNEDCATETMLHSIKQPVGKFVIAQWKREKLLLLERTRIVRRDGTFYFRFWQAGGGHDRNLDRAKTIDYAIDYIHANPVRRGLCALPTDWKWSSARYWNLDEDEFEMREVYGCIE